MEDEAGSIAVKMSCVLRHIWTGLGQKLEASENDEKTFKTGYI